MSVRRTVSKATTLGAAQPAWLSHDSPKRKSFTATVDPRSVGTFRRGGRAASALTSSAWPGHTWPLSERKAALALAPLSAPVEN